MAVMDPCDAEVIMGEVTYDGNHLGICVAYDYSEVVEDVSIPAANQITPSARPIVGRDIIATLSFLGNDTVAPEGNCASAGKSLVIKTIDGKGVTNTHTMTSMVARTRGNSMAKAGHQGVYNQQFVSVGDSSNLTVV